jgi:electron transfer flavoprotein alpha subunit
VSISLTRPLRVVALVKQIPAFEEMQLGPDGRLRREGLELHMNDYCRRGVAKGHELARASGGTLTVLTLGPPSAENVLREAIAFGADDGVLVTDPAFAGSDTLATARALAAAIERIGPYDLILCGRNSVDADTGQVPAELAELLGLPFATGVRELALDGEVLGLRLEHDDEWVDATVELPAVLSCAERLCDPCKIKDPVVWADVDGSRICALAADDLGPGPWGQAGSPTSVGEVRALEVERGREILTGPLIVQVDRAVELLRARGALGPGSLPRPNGASVPVNPSPHDGPVIAVVVEPDRPRVARELLGAAAGLAVAVGGRVTALGPALDGGCQLSAWGADHLVRLTGADVEEDLAGAVAEWATTEPPWAVLAPGTSWGRELASRVAVRLGAGLTGDAIAVRVEDGRLVADKPAFGGRLVAEIQCSSPVQMATVRPGVLPLLVPRPAGLPTEEPIAVDARSRLRVLDRQRDDDSSVLVRADVVIGVGVGVEPDAYPRLRAHAAALGAELAATRKVTDRGWMPRARQVGITGHSVAPRLYLALGMSGKFNHVVGVRSAGTIVAINPDPDAPIFDSCDIGFVGDWAELLETLVPRLAQADQA